MMKEFLEQKVREVIHQSITRYNQKPLGFIRDAETAISKFIAMNPDILPTEAECANGHSFSLWKNRLLEAFYLQLNFYQFAENQRNIRDFRNTFKGLLLKQIQPRKSTVYHKLSSILFDMFFDSLPEQSFSAPSRIEETLIYLFRLDMRLFITELAQPNSKYWGAFADVVADIVKSATQKWSISSDDMQDVLAEVYSVLWHKLNKKSDFEKLCDIEGSDALCDYMYGIAKNILLERGRRNKKEPMILFDDLVPNKLNMDEDESDDVFSMVETPAEATDAMNLFLEAFLDQYHPWHQQLVAKHEHDAELLLLHYRDGLDYRSIVERLFPHLDEIEKSKKIINIRKQSERAKHFFHTRFLAMMRV